MVIILISADLLCSLMGFTPYMIDIRSEYLPCELAAYVDGAVRASSILWTGMFADSLDKYIVGKQKDFMIKPIPVILICIVLPIAIGTVPFAMDWYGSSYILCWVKADETTLSLMDQFLISVWAFYWIFVVVFFYNLYKYAKLIMFLRKHFENRSEIYQLLFYPGILFVCNVPAVVFRLCFTFYGADTSVTLGIVAGVCFQIQGFLNALIYGTNYTVKTAVKNYIRQKCGSIISISSVNVSYEEQTSSLSIISDSGNS